MMGAEVTVGGRNDNEDYLELRVHGVAGTPPESMLGLSPVPTQPPVDPEGRVKIYRPPSVPDTVRAFSWSALTSGSAMSALWLLLLPYMLANVAGWAMMPLRAYRAPAYAPATRPLVIRWITLIVRLGGFLVTAIFVLFALLTLADIVGYQGVMKGERLNADLARYAPAAGVAATAGVVGLLFAATYVRLRPGAPDPWGSDRDPVGLAWLDRSQERMWNSPGIITRLHRLHLAAALSLTALVSMLSLEGTRAPWGLTDQVLTFVAAGGITYSLLFLTIISLSDGRGLGWATQWIKWAWVGPLVAVMGAAWRFAHYDLTAEPGVDLPAIRGSGGWVALLLVLMVVAGYLVSWFGRDPDRAPRWSSFNQPSLLLTGATVGTIFGAGLAAQAGRLFGGDKECTLDVRTGCKPVVGDVIDWISVGFTWALTLLLWIVLVWFAVAFLRAGNVPARLMVALRAMTDDVSKILTLLASIGMTALLIALWVGSQADFGPVVVDSGVAAASVVLLVTPFALAASVLLYRFVSKFPWWAWAVVIVVLAGFGWWIATSAEPFEVAGITLPPPTFLSFVRTVAITLPTTLVLGRLMGAFRNRNARRGVAIMWDLGNFWPRWFHPFAPPTYSDVAVTRLTDTVDNRLMANGAVLLAPHSQGSIIAAASVNALSAPTKRLAFLTYGSPLSRLYARVFPAVFTRETFLALCDRLASSPKGPLRWKNLFRPSDPIGGKVAAVPPGIPDGWSEPLEDVDCSVPVRFKRNHSDYQKEPEYKEEARKLSAAITIGVAADTAAESD